MITTMTAPCKACGAVVADGRCLGCKKLVDDYRKLGLPPHAVCRCDESAQRKYTIKAGTYDQSVVCYACMLAHENAGAKSLRVVLAGEDENGRPLSPERPHGDAATPEQRWACRCDHCFAAGSAGWRPAEDDGEEKRSESK